MIHLDDIYDALMADGPGVVSIDFAPCEECDTYHVISQDNDTHLCERCGGSPAPHLLQAKIEESLRVNTDGISE